MFPQEESLRKAEHFLQTGALNTTSYINAQSLSMGVQGRTGQGVSGRDGSDVLSGAGYFGGSRNRISRQGSGNRGPDVFAGVFEKTGKISIDKVYLLGDTDKQAQELQEMLLNAQENLNIVDVRGYEEFELSASATDERDERSCAEGDFFPDDISAGSGADAQRPQIFKRGALGGVAGDEIKRKGENDVLEKGAEKDFSEKS